jgi:hypothetical protein
VTTGLFVACVHQEPIQPHFETLRVPSSGYLSPGKQERLLDGVLRPIDIAQDAICDPVAPVAIKVDELGERIFVAVTRALDQRCPHQRSLSW